MNQLPITLTLYYPTAAQFESFAMVSALSSIAIGIWLLIITFGDPSFFKNGREKILPFAFLLVTMNPYGGLASLLGSLITGKEYILAARYLASPVLFLYIWAI